MGASVSRYSTNTAAERSPRRGRTGGSRARTAETSSPLMSRGCRIADAPREGGAEVSSIVRWGRCPDRYSAAAIPPLAACYGREVPVPEPVRAACRSPGPAADAVPRRAVVRRAHARAGRSRARVPVPRTWRWRPSTALVPLVPGVRRASRSRTRRGAAPGLPVAVPSIAPPFVAPPAPAPLACVPVVLVPAAPVAPDAPTSPPPSPPPCRASSSRLPPLLHAPTASTAASASMLLPMVAFRMNALSSIES